MRGPARIAAGVFALLGGATAAQAQPGIPRAWVASNGNNANPCTRASPCRTFAGALARLSDGGEINCVDSSEYGPFDAAIALTVDCRQAPGRIQAAGGPGIRLRHPGPNILRGLVVSGAGAAGSEVHGIEAGGTLTIDNVTVQGFNANASWGLIYAPGGVLVIRDSTFLNNGFTNSGGGILLGAITSTTATLQNVRALNNGPSGLLIDVRESQSFSSNIAISDSQFSGNQTGLQMGAPISASSPGGSLTLSNVRITGNSMTGLSVTGNRAFVSVTDSIIAANGRGILFGDGVGIVSFGDNFVGGNAWDGFFNVTQPKT